MTKAHVSSKHGPASDAEKRRKERNRPWPNRTAKFSAAPLLLVALLLLARIPPLRGHLLDGLNGAGGQAAAARIARILLAGRYRYSKVVPAMIWNNGKQPRDAHETVDFLSSVVLSTDSPFLLLFARFDIFGPEDPPEFDISIDGGTIKTIVWKSVFMPQRLELGAPGEHTIVIHANPLRYYAIGIPFPLQQNIITGFAVPARYGIRAKPEPARRHMFVTVTDSIGQGFRTPDPVRDAWTARLADSGRWPGTVMNRGFVGARLADFCGGPDPCGLFADSLDRDYPNAAAYYFALGTVDFATWQRCIPPSVFAASFESVLRELHRRNPQAVLYLQTPLHRADDAQPNACGYTLLQFRDAEQRMVEALPWITLIDGFSPSFPQATLGTHDLQDGIHPTAQGQEEYFHAVLESLHLGT
jgi:hypothetical protein